MKNNDNRKIKYRKDDDKQIALGVRVTVDAFKRSKKVRYVKDAVAYALRPLDIREAAILPRPATIQEHVVELKKAIYSKKRPEGEHGWQIVLAKAYDEITGGQIDFQELNEPENPGAATVNNICDQENVAGLCDEEPEEDCIREDCHKKDECTRAWIHDLQVAHCALVMARLATESESYHIENGKVSIVLPYMSWYDLCMHYNAEMEVI